MAGSGRQSWEKRQREKAKRERQEAKRADRAERKNNREEDDGLDVRSEAELFEKFAKLSEAHADGRIDDDTFETRRTEILELLGVQTD